MLRYQIMGSKYVAQYEHNFCSEANLSRWDYRHPLPMHAQPNFTITDVPKKTFKKHSHKEYC